MSPYSAEFSCGAITRVITACSAVSSEISPPPSSTPMSFRSCGRGVKGTNARPTLRTRGRLIVLSQHALGPGGYARLLRRRGSACSHPGESCPRRPRSLAMTGQHRVRPSRPHRARARRHGGVSAQPQFLRGQDHRLWPQDPDHPRCWRHILLPPQELLARRHSMKDEAVIIDTDLDQVTDREGPTMMTYPSK